MNVRTGWILGVAAIAASASATLAQPRIVALNGAANALSDDGTIVVGSLAQTARFVVGANAVTFTQLGASTSGVSCSSDGAYITGAILNSAGAGGLATTATITGRWLNGAWTNLGVFPTPPGSGVSSGSIHDPRGGISPNGQFIVGQGYVAPNNSFRFRPYFWDAAGNGGAGAFTVLPTTLTTSGTPRPKDGRALDVSADGAVVTGGEEPSSSAGRPVVWRWNPNTLVWDETFLPIGADPNTNALYTSTVDTLRINRAGTIIIGKSFEYDAQSGFPQDWVTKWTWNANTLTWDRALLFRALTTPASWYAQFNDCTIPPTLNPTAMTEDGNTVIGYVVYSTCGSFIRGGFIWNAAENEAKDLFDHLVELGTPGMATYDTLHPGVATPGDPPALGFGLDITPDGSSMVGYGGPQTGFGGGWLVNFAGGGCVDPVIVTQPNATATFSRCANTITASVSVIGSPNFTYQWYKDGQPLADGGLASGASCTGATTRLCRITNPRPADAGSYHCVIGGCSTSVTSTALVASVDPAVTQPANDLCINAISIGEGTVAFNACAAWNDDASSSLCVPGSTADVWYRYTPTFTGEARFETCAANYDTNLALFSGCGGSQLACNDDRDTGPSTSCGATRSRIGRYAVTAGVPIWVRVATTLNVNGSGTTGTTGSLAISIAPPLPVNDECANASVAVVGANAFSTIEATPDYLPSCAVTPSRDVWYTYTAPYTGTLRAATCPGTSFNTIVTILDGCLGNELGCNDDANVSGCFSQSIVTIPVTTGQQVWIRVSGNNPTTFGAGTLTLTFTLVCLSDFNHDNAVNSNDVSAYLNQWFLDQINGTLLADFDGNFETNSNDVSLYLNTWFADMAAGCPG